MLSRKQLALEGIAKCQKAMEKVVALQERGSSPEIRELANAVRWLSFGVQEIALALTEEGRVDDLPSQRSK